MNIQVEIEGQKLQKGQAKRGLTTRLERTVESLFVYRSSRSAAAQPERYAAHAISEMAA